MAVRFTDRTWETRRARPGKILKQRFTLQCLLLIGVISSLCGCTSLSNFHDGCKYSGSWNGVMTGYRNVALSSRAWHARKHSFCREKYLSDFCRGFRDGYEAVADGSDGCTPAVAPREYWSWKYQTAEGQSKSASWFAGYPHGARAAEEDGIGNWSQIQTSAGIQAEYAQFGLMEGQQAGIYPIPAPSSSKTVSNIPQQYNSTSILAPSAEVSSVFNGSIPYNTTTGTPVSQSPINPLSAPTTW